LSDFFALFEVEMMTRLTKLCKFISGALIWQYFSNEPIDN